MRFILFASVAFFIFETSLYAQNLLEERIRKISKVKKSVFLEQGIFHNGNSKIASNLKAIRHSYSEKRGYERIVFDFMTDTPPRIYGHISSAENKVYIDFFKTGVLKNVDSFGRSELVHNINIFPVNKESLSVELKFKSKSSVDIFYLESPGRVVIDVKKI